MSTFRLKKYQLDAFCNFLKSCGHDVKRRVHDNQVAQVRKDGHWMAIYSRRLSSDVLTVDKRLGDRFEQFHQINRPGSLLVSPDGCGCCGDACKGRGSCRHADENPAPMGQAERQPLTDDQHLDAIDGTTLALRANVGCPHPKHVVELARAVERACADAWGVKLTNAHGAEGGAA